MKNRKYFYQYIIIMLGVTLIVEITTYFYIAFDLEADSYTFMNWFETFAAIFLCYFILPAFNASFLFRGFFNKKVVINSSIKARVRRLPVNTVLGLIPGYCLWHLFFCLPSALENNSIIIRVNIVLILTYINIIIPVFIAYMLTSNIRKEIKKDFFNNHNIVFDPGITKIWQKLLLMALFISVFPVIILYLDGYVNFDQSLGENRRFLSNIDLGLVAISIIISIIIITKDIIDPVNKMINSFKLIRNGDFTKRMAVTTQNEMGILTHNFNLMADGLEEREKIKGVFGQYVSPAIAEEILSQKDALEGEEREVTVLFTDIKGYTSISETLTPSENISLLNEYYELLIYIVKNYGGTVNKFIGDAIMVIFNAPTNDPIHPTNAVACAKKIVEETNNRLFGNNIKLITRVGINTGFVIAGRLGGMDRFEYTIIGDTVNIAQRLEQFNKITKTQILLSHETASNINNSIKLKKIGRASVKGKTEKLFVYTTI